MPPNRNTDPIGSYGSTHGAGPKRFGEQSGFEKPIVKFKPYPPGKKMTSIPAKSLQEHDDDFGSIRKDKGNEIGMATSR